MIRHVRKKLASSISEITSEEDFLYNTWLRVVPSKEVTVGKISSSLIDTSKIVYSLEKPLPTEHFFLLDSSTVYPEDSKHLFEKVGTNPIFFALMYIPSKIITHEEIDPKPAGESAINIEFLLPKSNPWEVTVKFQMPEPAGYLFRLDEPEIKDYLSNLKTKIEKIELLNLDELFADYNATAIRTLNVKSFGKLKIKKLKVERIRKTPKLYKMNVPGMGKYKSKISLIKLQILGKTKISKSVNLIINEPSIASGKYQIDSPVSAKYFD